MQTKGRRNQKSRQKQQIPFAFHEECRTLLVKFNTNLQVIVSTLPVIISRDTPLANFEQQTTVLSTAQARESLIAASQAVSTLATKFTVAWKGLTEGMAEGSGAEDVKPFCEQLETAINNLVITAALLVAARRNYWSSIVIDSLRNAIAAIIEGVERLAQAFLEMKISIKATQNQKKKNSKQQA
jgi:hypothetical protein